MAGAHVNFFSNLWSTIWFFFWIFAFIAYLMALFSVISDLFRDHALAGGYKALWIIGLVFIPFLTVLAYLIFRGRGLSERQRLAQTKAQENASAYVKELAGTSAADEIGKAKVLLDSNTITQAEFDSIKARALA
jgi:hypothetical protein